MPKDSRSMENDFTKLMKEADNHLSGKVNNELDYEKPKSHITNSALWKGVSEEESKELIAEHKKKQEELKKAQPVKKVEVEKKPEETKEKTALKKNLIKNNNSVFKEPSKPVKPKEDSSESNSYYNTFNNPYAFENQAFTEVTGKEASKPVIQEENNLTFIKEVPSFIPAKFLKPIEPVKKVPKALSQGSKQLSKAKPPSTKPVLPKPPSSKPILPK